MPREVSTLNELKLRLLKPLRGKLNLLQSYEERFKVIYDELLKLAHDPDFRGALEKNKIAANEKLLKDFTADFMRFEYIQPLLDNPDVEDIIIDGLEFICVHDSKKGFVKTEIKFPEIDSLNLFIKKLILFSGRPDIESKIPIINLELPDNTGRVNITQSPFGPQLTITRAKINPLSIIDLIDKNALSFELAAHLWLYVEGMSSKPANIIIAGGPGSGKTTLLNALLGFIPPRDRLVIIEDTLELNTSQQFECSRLESTEKVSLLDLVKNSLRMRPDRIIIGEVRGAEARDLMTAMNVGRYCMGTLHASTAREAVIRLQNEPMNVPSVLINLVDVLIIMKKKERPDSVTRVINELVETAGLEQKEVLLCSVWKYDEDRDRYIELSPGPYRDHLAKAKGFAPTEIINEAKLRVAFLQALKDKNLYSYSDAAKYCGLYSVDKKKALAEVGL